MKLNFTDFLRKCQFPLLFALGLFPGPAMIIIATLPPAWPVMWLYPVVYVCLAWLCLVLPGKIRLIAGVLGAAGLMGLGFALIPEQSLMGAVSLLTPALYSAVLLAGLRMAGWPRERELSFAMLAAGVALHALWQALVILGTAFDFAATPMFLCFLGYLLLGVLSMNRSSVNTSAMGRQKISAVMKRQNLFLTLGLLALVLLIAMVPAVIAAIETAWNWLMALVDQVMLLLYKLLNPTGEDVGGGGAGGAGMDLSGLEKGEPSAFALIMEKVAIVIAAILAVVLLCFVARVVYRKLKILFRYILRRLNEYAAHSTEDYEDEITDTREGGEKERVGLTRRLWQFDRVDEKKLTPAQRIRYRYQKLMRRHRDWAPGTTARETLPQQAAEIYERVRYSDHPVDEKDAENFVSNIKQV